MGFFKTPYGFFMTLSLTLITELSHSELYLSIIVISLNGSSTPFRKKLQSDSWYTECNHGTQASVVQLLY